MKNNEIHVVDVTDKHGKINGKNRYKVAEHGTAVHKDHVSGHLSETDLDDLSEGGYRVKHLPASKRKAEHVFEKGMKVKDIHGNLDTVTAVQHPMVYTTKRDIASVAGGYHHTKVFPQKPLKS